MEYLKRDNLDDAETKKNLVKIMDHLVHKKILKTGEVILTINRHSAKEPVGPKATVKVFGCIISGGEERKFKQVVDFDGQFKQDSYNIINKKKDEIEYLRRQEVINQRYLPKSFKDSTLLEQYD